LKTTGTFLFNILEACVCATKNGLPQWVASLQAMQAYDDESGQWVDYSGYEDNETTAYLVLFGKDGKSLLNAKQLQKAIGWSGTSFEELDQMDYSGIQVQGRLEEHEYNNNTTVRVQWIDHKDADPTRALQRLNADALKKLNAKFASGMRELGGGPKPKSVPPVAPAPIPSPTTTATMPAIATPIPAPTPAPTPGVVQQVDPKEEARKKYEAKKERVKKAEAKAEQTAAKLGKSQPPKPPMPPKPVAITAKGQALISLCQKYSLPAACNQEQAWEACAQHRKTDITDDELANIWIQTIGDIGGEEIVGEDWYKVRNAVLEVVGK